MKTTKVDMKSSQLFELSPRYLKTLRVASQYARKDNVSEIKRFINGLVR